MKSRDRLDINEIDEEIEVAAPEIPTEELEQYVVMNHEDF